MARKFKKMTSIKDTEGGNFGGYKEENGGGTPVGGHFGGPSGRVGWKERGEPGHRQEQPRTSDGKFTYNSVNGMKTEYDGRGKTVNPLLTGGENGIYIKDRTDKKGQFHEGAETQFRNRSGAFYDKWKDKWYQKGSEKVSKEGKKYAIKLSANDVWNSARFSIGESGEFDAHSKAAQKAGLTAEGQNWDETKKGAPGKAGAIAKKEAKKTGQEQYVKTQDGGILRFKDSNAASGMAAKLGIKGKNINSNLKHTPAQIKQARTMMTSAGYDTNGFTDEQIDAVMDEFISSGN